MQAKLHLIKGNPQGKQVEIPEGTLTVGRAEDSDLIIASTRVSRHHCEIINAANQLSIRDKGSGNGTLVNGAKVTEQALRPGDEVNIGPLTFAVEINGVRESGAKPVAPAAKPAAAPKPAVAPAAKLAAALKPAAPAKPAAAAKPAAPAAAKPAGAKSPFPGSKPAAAAKPAAAKGAFPMPPAKRPAGDDILASLEKLSGTMPPKKPAAAPPAEKKDENVLEISDEDLLDPDK